MRVLRSIAQALDLSAGAVLAHAGLLDDRDGSRPTEEAIASDPVLSEEQKEALLAVYRSYVLQQEREEADRSSPGRLTRVSAVRDRTAPRRARRQTSERSEMSDSVYRVTDVIGVSPDSWEAAARNAVETAGRTVRDLASPR